MNRVLNRIRLFAVATFAILALAIPSLSAHAAPAVFGKSVKCDKAMLKQAHNEAVAAVGYLNYLDSSYNSSALTNALKEEKKVVDNTKDCNHLSKAFDNAYKASGDYYNFYYNVLSPNAHNAYTEAAKKHIANAYNQVEVLYASSK